MDDNEDKLITRLNDCINIENNIKSIIEIDESLKKYNSKEIKIKFLSEDEKINELSNRIKEFGKIINENDIYKFKFKPGNNYNITNNALKAIKQSGGNQWNCVVIGDKEIPKNKISKWKIKVNNIRKAPYNSDTYIGIGPKNFQGSLYNECWSIYCSGGAKLRLQMKDNSSNYNNLEHNLKKDDIIEVIVDRIKGNLSFTINGINCGIACSDIPKEVELYPTIVLYEQNLSIEIVE